MSTALLLIDIQNDYFPGGNNELHEPFQASLKAGKLLAHFRKAGLPVVHIQHIAIRPGAKTFLPGTRGSEIHEHVCPLPGEKVIQKNYPNSFRGTPLLETLHAFQVGRLVIAGMMTHMCVDASARAAFDYGFECQVISDACATKNLQFGGQIIPAEAVHGAFLAALNGTYSKVMTTQEFMDYSEVS